MSYDYFSRNGEILPAEQAAVPLDDIAYAYGFGVYETVRATNGTIYFLPEHCQRLLDSAEIIGLEHSFSIDNVQEYVKALVAKMDIQSSNIKILLIGGATREDATLYIQCLNPLFPDRKLYKTGVRCITERYERLYPHSKSLNMLPSYLAYRRARQNDAYDALLINERGCITEGTRTNFFGMRGRAIVSPPQQDILLGVTRDHVIQVAKQNGFEVLEENIKPYEVQNFDAVFLTSTSSRIMPIRYIDAAAWKPAVTLELQELMDAFSAYLEDYRA